MRRLMVALAILSATACGPLHRTPCGMELYSEELGTAWLDEAEALTLKRMSRLSAVWVQDEASMCTKLRGVKVVVRPDYFWAETDEGFIQVDGLSDCKARVITIAAHLDKWPDGAWQRLSIAHEITHQLHGCVAHYRWNEDGVYSQLGFIANSIPPASHH